MYWNSRQPVRVPLSARAWKRAGRLFCLVGMIFDRALGRAIGLLPLEASSRPDTGEIGSQWAETISDPFGIARGAERLGKPVAHAALVAAFGIFYLAISI